MAASSLRFPLSPTWVRSTADADIGDVMKQSKHIQEPDDHTNDHDRIQDGLDRSLHWYETVDQPKQDAHHDQNE
jgi:hypothetical protein